MSDFEPLNLTGIHAQIARGVLDDFEKTSAVRQKVYDLFSRGARVTELLDLGEGDFVLKVEGVFATETWTAVHNFQRPVMYVTTRDAALALLVAVKHEGANPRAHEYFCRMLGVKLDA